MNLIEIVKKHLQDNGYDGLVSDIGECGCFLDNLVPCGEPSNLVDCEPAYKVPGCNEFCGEGCEFPMSSHKPGQEK